MVSVRKAVKKNVVGAGGMRMIGRARSVCMVQKDSSMSPISVLKNAGMPVEHQYFLREMSSINLRTGRRNESRSLSDSIVFVCTFCGKAKKLGRNSEVFVRVEFDLFGKVMESIFCGVCVDLLADMSRFGPRVLSESHKWRRSSKVARISLIQGSLFCFNCLGTELTHVFLKFDDLFIKGRVEAYVTKRICARCMISYMELMKQCKDIGLCKFPEYIPEK